MSPITLYALQKLDVYEMCPTEGHICHMHKNMRSQLLSSILYLQKLTKLSAVENESELFCYEINYVDSLTCQQVWILYYFHTKYISTKVVEGFDDYQKYMCSFVGTIGGLFIIAIVVFIILLEKINKINLFKMEDLEPILRSSNVFDKVALVRFTCTT